MAGGTKLFQRPGSPLIQGHSRSDTPLWKSYVAGIFFCAAWAVIAWYLLELDDINLCVAYFAGALIGSVAGAYFGRAWGARRRWIPSLALGLLLANVAAIAMQLLVPVL